MSIHSNHKEDVFETEVVELLTKYSGYIEGTSKVYDKELAFYTEDLISYIKATSPKAYEKLEKMNGAKSSNLYWAPRLSALRLLQLQVCNHSQKCPLSTLALITSPMAGLICLPK